MRVKICGGNHFELAGRGLWCIGFFLYGLSGLEDGQSFCMRTLELGGLGKEGEVEGWRRVCCLLRLRRGPEGLVLLLLILGNSIVSALRVPSTK